MKRFKRLIIALLSIIVVAMLFACEKGNVVKALYTPIDMKNLPDGIYPVDIKKQTLSSSDDGAFVDVSIYSEDLYDTLDMHNLKVGDRIEQHGKLTKITKLVRDENTNELAINYWDSVKDADERFVPAETGGIYKVVGPDDHGSYTKRGDTRIKLSEKCVYTDSSDLENPPKVYNGINEVIPAFLVSDDYFIYLNTKIRMENGECIEIIRRYIP